MRTVRFAYYMNSKPQHESLSASERKEWSICVRSYKIGKRQRMTVLE